MTLVSINVFSTSLSNLPRSLNLLSRRSYSSIPDRLSWLIADIIISHSATRQNPLLGPNKSFPFPGDVKCNYVPSVAPIAKDSKKSELTQKDASTNTFKLSKYGTFYGTIDLKRFSSIFLNRTHRNHVINFKPTEEHKLEDRSKFWQNIRLRAFTCSWLLQKEIYLMFHGFTETDLSNKNITMISLTEQAARQKAEDETEQETELAKEELTSRFINMAHFLCDKLQSLGYFASFLDPLTGQPFCGRFRPTTPASASPTEGLSNTFKQMGFLIKRFGDCAVVENIPWSETFLGCVFTDAPLSALSLIELNAE
jgi:hypothetical protein